MSARNRPTYVQLGPMFHWSPRSRRKGILRSGLLPNMRPTVTGGGAYINNVTGELEEWRMSAVCMSPSPQTAWDYSAGTIGDTGETWDLWQIRLADTDEIHVRPDFGPYLIEIRVANRIPKSRLWWVGERTKPSP